MVKTLTKKQKQLLAVITDLQRKNSKTPTLEEIRQAMSYKAISSVQRHVDALKKKGFLNNKKHQPRSLEVNLKDKTVNVPLIGSIACGIPFLAEENIEAYIPYFQSKLKGQPQDFFFLKAVGDSMNNSKPKINHGDFVLVEKTKTAQSGQRVVALIGEEATIKLFKKKKDMIILQPESTNKQNKPIIIFSNLLIQGRVVDVIKKGN
jgi:repressor LexA